MIMDVKDLSQENGIVSRQQASVCPYIACRDVNRILKSTQNVLKQQFCQNVKTCSFRNMLVNIKFDHCEPTTAHPPICI